MPVDLTGARLALALALFGDSITLPAGSTLADGSVCTVPTAVLGNLGSRSGGRDTSGDLIKERGAYTLALPIGTQIASGARLRFAGRMFKIVWTPPATGMSLAQSYGLEEVK